MDHSCGCCGVDMGVSGVTRSGLMQGGIVVECLCKERGSRAGEAV